MKRTATDVAFTRSVKFLQERHGSRAAYARLEEHGGWQTVITRELAEFISARDSLYLATASAQGQPYVQHRGGPKGFVKVLDQHTLAFAEWRGNRQYITAGNLLENPRAFLFFMDYEHRRRVKFWGTAQAFEDYGHLAARLELAPGRAPERVIVFTLVAWDENCPRHIVRRFDEEHVKALVRELHRRIAELEAENARLLISLGDFPSTPA